MVGLLTLFRLNYRKPQKIHGKKVQRQANKDGKYTGRHCALTSQSEKKSFQDQTSDRLKLSAGLELLHPSHCLIDEKWMLYYLNDC